VLQPNQATPVPGIVHLLQHVCILPLLRLGLHCRLHLLHQRGDRSPQHEAHDMCAGQRLLGSAACRMLHCSTAGRELTSGGSATAVLSPKSWVRRCLMRSGSPGGKASVTTGAQSASGTPLWPPAAMMLLQTSRSQSWTSCGCCMTERRHLSEVYRCNLPARTFEGKLHLQDRQMCHRRL
jgi:hypothetical protein